MKNIVIKVEKCEGKNENKKVLVTFDDKSNSLRNIYKAKRKGVKYFCHKYNLYKIYNFDGMSYEFEIIDEETKKEIESDKEEKIELSSSVLEDGFVEYVKNPKHSEESTIKACIKNDLPVYLAGPAGSGKNFVLQKIAEDLEMDFYFTNSVQQEYKITGFIDAGGVYHETEFYKAFKDGGLFFLDELDASIPEVLVLLNAAIANRYFEFPNGRIDAHPDFRVVAAGNTFGSGADSLYTGRMVIDQSTLDRFVIIEFDYERKIELAITKGNAHLVDFIRELRRVANEYGIRATFSYRCLTMVKGLQDAGIDMEKILKIAVFKGMSQDTINTFSSIKDERTKYHTALRNLIYR